MEISNTTITGHIYDTNRENANLVKNPEEVSFHLANDILERYALDMLPDHLRRLHTECKVHFHDLNSLPHRSINCMQHDARFTAQMGLSPAGLTGRGVYAKPATRLHSFMHQLSEAMHAGQSNLSGGQGIPAFNTFCAPFAEGLTYPEIKKAVQSFIYNMGVLYSSRGGQTVFSSVQMDIGMPKFLRDQPAYAKGGQVVGTYGDYYEESHAILRAFTEEMLRGDGHGHPFLFPNTIYALTKESFKPEFDEEMEIAHKVSEKHGNNYFLNLTGKTCPEYISVMGCRTSLPSNWTGDPITDCFRAGNLSYASINLPRIGLDSNSDEDLFFEILGERMDLVKEYLTFRRNQAKKLFAINMFPFLNQFDHEGRQYYEIDNSTDSFGVVGMDDLCHNMLNKGIETPEGQEFATKVLNFMNKRKDEYTDEENHKIRYSIIGSPAESACGRFAQYDHKIYGDKAYSNGEEGDYYYSNSCHFPVNTGSSLVDKIKWESTTHPLMAGGAILNCWIGESYTEWESLRSFTDKICNTEARYFTYSSALTICDRCGLSMKGIQDKCVRCGCTDQLRTLDKITGYLQNTSGWNNAKQQEFKDRRRVW